MLITKKPLSRRAALRGLGTVVALPVLDAMVPTTKAMAAETGVRRLQVLYTPNGMMMENFTPVDAGADFAFTPILKPLEPYRRHVTVVTGLAHTPAKPLGDPGGAHGRACGTYLTGVHVRQTEGADLGAGISMDQIVAKQLGQATQLPSLELGLEAPSMAGSCDVGFSCAYTNTLSWANANTPLPITTNPREVFERLFGDGDSLSKKDRLARLKHQASILDFSVKAPPAFRVSWVRKIGTGWLPILILSVRSNSAFNATKKTAAARWYCRLLCARREFPMISQSTLTS